LTHKTGRNEIWPLLGTKSTCGGNEGGRNLTFLWKRDQLSGRKLKKSNGEVNGQSIYITAEKRAYYPVLEQVMRVVKGKCGADSTCILDWVQPSSSVVE